MYVNDVSPCSKTLARTLPITTDTDNPLHQSKYEAHTCRRWKAKENVRKQVMIGFGITSVDCWERSASFLKANTKRNTQIKENATKF